MTDAAFLTAILADPDSDTPRLVYADWLDDNEDEAGRARAGLIRAQCELERHPAAARRKELKGQVKRLLAAHGERWRKPLTDVYRHAKSEFRRGFVEHVTMPATEFDIRAEDLFAAVPTVRAARFPEASNEVWPSEWLADMKAAGRPVHFDPLATSPHLARLTEVDLREMCRCGRHPIGDELRELFASPHVANLTALNVAGNRLDANGFRALAESPHLGRLVALDLSSNDPGEVGVRALAGTTRLPALRSLTLGGCDIHPRAGRVLATSPLAARLTRLDLHGNRLGDFGGRAFATADRSAGWELLDLRENLIGPEVAKRLRARFGQAVKV